MEKNGADELVFSQADSEDMVKSFFAILFKRLRAIFVAATTRHRNKKSYLNWLVSLAILLGSHSSSDGGSAHILQAYTLATSGSFLNGPLAESGWMWSILPNATKMDTQGSSCVDKVFQKAITEYAAVTDGVLWTEEWRQ